MKSVIFLTGATGFLGSQVARQLLTETDGILIALVRAESPATAARRLARSWWDWPELANAIGERVQILVGDVSAPRLGLDDDAYDDLVRRMTHVIHAAADLRLNAPLDELRATNVRGTAHVLDLARAAHHDHGLARLSHVSTAYVAGRRRGAVPEAALSDADGFSSAYERTKYEGECLVQAAQSELPVSVFRPGMIVGDSRTGAIQTFNTLYFPLRLYMTGQLRVLPTQPDLPVNLVPVDYVAQAVVRLTLDPRAAGLNFHLVAPREALPTVRELVTFVRQWAESNLNLTLPRPVFLPLPAALTWRLKLDGPWGTLLSLLPYMDARLTFRRDNVDRLLGPYPVDWRALLPVLLEYATARSFFHRTGRTVHEQVLFRLRSPSRPVTYHDVVEGQIVTRDTAQVRRDMLAAAEALRALGVRPGDRVALVGLNSSRYLTLDVALGLVGAVSVPLYYTSPPAELDEILAASGAKLLFVGAPKLLAQLDAFATDLPVVSFCRGLSPDDLPRQVMDWDAFLDLGEGSKEAPAAPVDMGDVATLRYTSGTTGRPKGVVFEHAHLRWMAQTLIKLLPWQARNAPAAYLSFLPMNHVVEGILGTYAPYYVPAAIDVYFLEDFYGLAEALPQVRPTIFFSVPRFYEKVWENLSKSRIGRLYQEASNGLLKRLLRPLVRRGLLKKAGLDRCAQLIVGSAPSSEELLRAWRELGIEVHDAYGLTEAPLVTLNRLGQNQLGTVGAPLPETQVRLAEDGEVQVRGPQVTAGYFETDVDAPFQDGWLCTGDLGRLTPEGRLVICGRKKELLKTSYGKYIRPLKIETALRGVPGVVEALVVGDSRPYCAALLWVKDGRRDALRAGVIDRAVERLNANLSHPEQVKRWAVLAYDLSVAGGDLTANLKLKRRAVTARRADVIQALYDAGDLPGDVLHLGGVADTHATPDGSGSGDASSRPALPLPDVGHGELQA